MRAQQEEEEGRKEGGRKAKSRRRTLEVGRDDDPRSVSTEAEEVLDDAAEEACAVVGLGAFAELVEDEERARRQVAQGEAAAGTAGDRQ